MIALETTSELLFSDDVLISQSPVSELQTTSDEERSRRVSTGGSREMVQRDDFVKLIFPCKLCGKENSLEESH